MSGDSSSISVGLTALSQPLKLNLVRASHEEQLRNYGGHTVLIEPLASMAAVEYFLWPRVQRNAAEAAREEAARANRAAAEEVGALRFLPFFSVGGSLRSSFSAPGDYFLGFGY